ncbi:MAG: putative transport protein YhhT [Phycisphaerae bacterium]|nr:putative transport protein YhhT [Phycisphaerae bacterium]
MPGMNSTVPPARIDFDRVIRWLLTAGLLVGSLWLIAYLRDVLIPFAVAILIAYLLNPLVNLFERRLGRRQWAVLLTMSLFSVTLLVLLPLMGWLIYTELADVGQTVTSPEVRQRIAATIEPWLEQFKALELQKQLQDFRDHTDAAELQQMVLDGLKLLAPRLWEATGQVVGWLGGVLNALLALSGVVVIYLYVVFLLMDFRGVQSGWKQQLPPAYRETLVEFWREFSKAMARYFRGQLVVAFLTGMIMAIGFSIVGLRMAALLGLFIGMLNMVPYLQLVGVVPAVLLALLKALESGSNPLGPLVGVAIVFAVAQLVQDGFLVPKIMGESLGLRPWVIMLSLFVWGKLLGVLGLVLAIPLSCLGLAYYRKFVLHRPITASTELTTSNP